MKLKELKKGDFFTKKAISDPSESQVWVRGDYDRSAKKYDCYKFEDVNVFCQIKGDKEVFCDFIF